MEMNGSGNTEQKAMLGGYGYGSGYTNIRNQNIKKLLRIIILLLNLHFIFNQHYD